ncbi:MAG: IS1634 family transposase [Thermodesulfobacteriota bacterium]|nr:IS1634 family transposase [Thermodesulfobacteriota bacterium]
MGFDLSKDKWKDLANCIEEIISGQKSLFDYPKALRTLARRYARKIIREQASVIAERQDIEPDYETIDLNSVEDEEVRTVGAEHVVYEAVKQLGIDRKLKELGLNRHQVAASLGVIAGRMIVPGSERATHYWMQNVSALDELMGVDFSNLSLDRVYKVSDRLLKHKDSLEEHLRRSEGQLFALEEKIILYDLTNTFFEGTGKYNPKARYGRSKEKRSDCALVTLGLVLDTHGFPKKSQIFDGNISEPKTLETMIGELAGGEISEDSLIKPTIVLDAGIASEKNLLWLKDKHYPYIVVSRKKKKEIPSDVTMIAVKKDDKTSTILVQAGLAKSKETDELELYCHSIDKEKKEESIKTKFQERFEHELLKARNALHLRNGTKRYDKVVERIGRLKERFKLVSHRYNVSIEKATETEKAKNITWSHKKTEKTSGVYCLRTNRKDLNEQQIWDIYTMLTDIEDAFRCMKSELGLRPIYHQKEIRCDGHIFITLLAYHLLHTIRFQLRQKRVRFCWTTIRRQLSTQVRITTTMKRQDGKVIRIRKSSKAEPAHQVIYDALNLAYQPGRRVKTIL